MLSLTSHHILDQIRANGIDVEITEHRGTAIIRLYSEARDIDVCEGVGPDQEEELLTRLAVDYLTPTQLGDVLPRYSEMAQLMDMVAA